MVFVVFLETRVLRRLIPVLEKGTSFSLIRMDKKKKKYTIIAKSKEEKQDWISAIDRAATGMQQLDVQQRQNIQSLQGCWQIFQNTPLKAPLQVTA